LSAAFGIERQVLSFLDGHAFQTGFDFFFQTTGRHHLVEDDAQLSVAPQAARRTWLEHRALHMSSTTLRGVPAGTMSGMELGAT
jgi:hypothetical protein